MAWRNKSEGEGIGKKMKKNTIVCSLFWLVFVSCNPQQEVARRVDQTLAVLYTLTVFPSYTDYPTYTLFPSYTSVRSATLTRTATITPDYTASAMPTFTQRPTQPLNGTGAITATSIQDHIDGQLLRDVNCGISYEYPLGWISEYAKTLYPEKFLCFYGNRPKDYQQIIDNTPFCMSDYAIYTGVMNLSLEDAARMAMMEYRDGYWIAHGMQGFTTYAEMITTRGLVILRAAIYKEVEDRECEARGGIMEYDIAVINNGSNRSIVMWDDTTRFNLHFEYILQTIRFL
jgi:hypothetical protein